MATLDMISAAASTVMTEETAVDHLAKSSSSSSTWVWSTSGGLTITAVSLADDILGAATPTAGTIFALTAMSGTDLAYTVSGMAGDLVAMTAAPNLEAYWRAILAGSTTILASKGVYFAGAGDFMDYDIEDPGARGRISDFLGIELPWWGTANRNETHPEGETV